MIEKECLKCGFVAEHPPDTEYPECPECGVYYHSFEAQAKRLAKEAGLPLEQYLAEVKLKATAEKNSREHKKLLLQQKIIAAQKSGNWEGIPREITEKILSKTIVTTTNSIPGHEITEIYDVVSSECAFGMNIIFDAFADFRDFFGGRSQNVQKVLRDARRKTILELKKEAMMVGGNAVIGIDLDYSEFSGKNKSMLFVVASGTAVRAKKV